MAPEQLGSGARPQSMSQNVHEGSGPGNLRRCYLILCHSPETAIGTAVLFDHIMQ